MFAKTTTLSIRLVVLDYAGLCTNPMDVRTFVKYIETDLVHDDQAYVLISFFLYRNVKTIEQIVIDHGHKLESFNRAELNNHKVISKFDCRKAPVKRSSL